MYAERATTYMRRDTLARLGDELPRALTGAPSTPGAWCNDSYADWLTSRPTDEGQASRRSSAFTAISPTKAITVKKSKDFRCALEQTAQLSAACQQRLKVRKKEDPSRYALSYS